jgi:ATP phosphoribosyltransferase
LIDGVVDIAIVGDNLLVEKGGIQVIQKLGFQNVKFLLLFLKHLNTISDLDGMRIATYPKTVLIFLIQRSYC